MTRRPWIGISSLLALLAAGCTAFPPLPLPALAPTGSATQPTPGAGSGTIVQGGISSAVGPTNAVVTARVPSILGDDYFVLADSLSADAHLYVTRNGHFHWQQTASAQDGSPIYNLVDDQGLYVLRNRDIAYGQGSVLALNTTTPPPTASC